MKDMKEQVSKLVYTFKTRRTVDKYLLIKLWHNLKGISMYRKDLPISGKDVVNMVNDLTEYLNGETETDKQDEPVIEDSGNEEVEQPKPKPKRKRKSRPSSSRKDQN